jgi:hypothetical protein
MMKAWEQFIFECLVISLQRNDEQAFNTIFEVAQTNPEVARLLFRALLYVASQERGTINVTDSYTQNAPA